MERAIWKHISPHICKGRKAIRKQREKSEWCGCKPNNTKYFLKPTIVRKDAWNRLSLRAFRECGLLKPLLQNSISQNCEEINICCFKPPRLGYFARAALGNWYWSKEMGKEMNVLYYVSSRTTILVNGNLCQEILCKICLIVRACTYQLEKTIMYSLFGA